MPGRELYLGLHVLDRQLVDRRGRLVGKVDDLDLQRTGDGHLVVRAICSGRGVLLGRLGRRTLGRWLESMHAAARPGPAGAGPAGAGTAGTGPGVSLIPFSRVADIGNHVTLAAELEELPTYRSERWVADHVLRHIPGSRHASE